MRDGFTATDWHWIVAGDESRFWSSAAGGYVDTLPENAGVTRIASEAELSDLLRRYGLRGPLVTAADVIAERERRLGLGFDHDFGGERGVHRIGTTPADMIGWDEVSKFAAALVALGDTATLITIVTDTGPCQVTALEWQQVLVSAALFRQPLWAASFAMQAMEPIPADFDGDLYWSYPPHHTANASKSTTATHNRQVIGGPP